MRKRTPSQRESARVAERVLQDPELAERFIHMAEHTKDATPVPDDSAWMSGKVDDDRVSLAPVEFEDALRALLVTRAKDRD